MSTNLVRAQKSFGDVDIYRIRQKKVREYVLYQQNMSRSFKEIQPSCFKHEDLSDLYELEYSYYIKEDINEVWEIYCSTSPARSWNGNMVSFGLFLSKWANKVMYYDEHEFNGIDTGQVFYINLSLAGGIYNLAVGIEIVDVNEDTKTIRFSYLEDGKSKGIQTIQMLPSNKGYTKIIHHTLFKSGSPFRDNILYPFFHKRSITDFHRNMDNIIALTGRRHKK